MASKTLIEALDGIWTALTGSVGGGVGPVRFQQVGIDGEPIDTDLPSEVALPDNVSFGVFSTTNANDVIGPFDTTGFNSILIEVQQVTGSLRVETSIDGVNRWTDLPAIAVDQLVTPIPGAVLFSTVKYRAPAGAKYVRVRQVGAGPSQAAVFGSQVPVVMPVINGGTLFYLESTANLPGVVSQPANTFNGSRRTNGGTAGSVGTRFRTFEARVRTNLAGTLYIDESIDSGTNWVEVDHVDITPTSSVAKGSLSVSILTADYRARFTNTDAVTTTSTMKITSGYKA